MWSMVSNATERSRKVTTVLLTHPGMYFACVCLVCSGGCLLIKADKVV